MTSSQATVSQQPIPSARTLRWTNKLSAWFRQSPAYLVLGAWSLFTVFAISWIIVSSFKTNRELFQSVWSLPSQLQFANYVKAWATVQVSRYFFNSLFIVAVAVALILAVSAPAAYVLSRVRFRGNQLLTLIFTAGIGIPTPLLFIPLFVIMAALHLVNTFAGLILVYVSLSIPFTVYMLTGFFSSLPTELEEAGIVDGCSDYQIFWHVMLPLASPGLITAAIFNSIGLWNEYQLALVMVSEPKFRTLSLGLYALQNAMQFTGDWVGLFAAVVIVMVPTIILYVFLSEKIITGITMGAVK